MQNLFETASASMPAKRASFTRSNCPYGVVSWITLKWNFRSGKSGLLPKSN
jgi:hypothetical protein